jgi:streptogramin lyase
LAGTDGSTDGTNTTAWFSGPNGLAVDSTTNIYVADYHNNTIRKLTPQGTTWVSSTIAGQAGRPGAVDGTNGAARFSSPVGVALDSQGNLYVADWGNDAIRQLTAKGTNWVTRTIAGRPGFAGSTDGTNSAIRFTNPFGVAVALDGTLYVTDYGSSVIRQLTPVGTNWISQTIAGLAGTPGSADGTNSMARFSQPEGVSVDGGINVYVTDWGNSTLRKLTFTGTNWVSTTIGGLAGSTGTTDGMDTAARFRGPSAVAIDRDGDLYVTDEGNDTIRLGAPLSLSTFAPMFQAVETTNLLDGDWILLTWSATPGLRYQLQSTPDLGLANWSNLSTYVATNGTIQAGDMRQTGGQNFYRLLIRP